MNNKLNFTFNRKYPRSAEGKERYLYIIKFNDLDNLSELHSNPTKDFNPFELIMSKEIYGFPEDFICEEKIEISYGNGYKYNLEIVTDRKEINRFLDEYIGLIKESILEHHPPLTEVSFTTEWNKEILKELFGED